MGSSLRNFGFSFAHPIALNAYLTRIIVGALGPLLVFSIFMMVLLARQEQANRQTGLENTARALILALDQEVKSSLTNLEALATSEPLDVGAVKVFQAAAKRIVETQQSWKALALFDPNGKRLASVLKPAAAEPIMLSRESLGELMRTRQPVIANQTGGGAAEIRIHVPVVRDRTIIYILSAMIDPRVFTEILAQQKIPSEWVGTLFDANKTIIARSKNARRLVGEQIGPPLTSTNVLGREQFLRGVDENGDSAYAAIVRSQLTGWFFALTVPASEVNAILYRSLAVAGGGGLMLLLTGLGVALFFSRRASDSLQELSRAAHDLGRGRRPAFPANTPISELDSVITEMKRAVQLLQEREAERDRVEGALRTQEQDLQRQADLLNLANEAIFARQIDGTITFWNRGAEQLYGYTQEEALGAHSNELLGTEYPQGREQFEAVLHKVGEWTGELRQRTKSGRRIDVESRFKLIHDRSGGQLILECNRDISQRKQSARRLATEHQVTLALAESETAEVAWHRVLEIVGTGLGWEAGRFWLVNGKSQTLECLVSSPSTDATAAGSERLSLLRGFGPPGRVWQSGEPVWIADAIREATTLQASLPNGEAARAVFAFPIKVRGDVLGVIEFVSASPRPADEDVLKTVQAIGGEIGQFAERMRAEAALRQREEHLRDQAHQLEQQLLASGRLVAVGELTASMAHEFNNPLGIILGFAEGLLESLNPGDPNYRHVQIISEEAKRCEKLVQELLEFGRPKSADFILTHVEQVVERTMNLVQPHAAKNSVETVAMVEPDLPPIYTDPQQLQQVLLNLSLNAVDAMPRGGKLTVEAKQHESGILIAVADTGIGIDDDVLPRIFQPFFTSKKRRGLGLGLPICDRIVKSHGGKIIVKSRPGDGTKFEIYLPRVPPGSSASAGSEDATAPAPGDRPSAAPHN